jgi:DNA-directed RNA polymerase subunit alpha
VCKAADIETVGDLVKIQKRNFAGFRNVGNLSIKEADDFITANGLSWGMEF